MVISKTPFRMSFFGGGTDFEEFYKKNGGAVISSTFDKYCYVTVRHLPRFFDYKSELSYSRVEKVNSWDEIEHPAIRNAMKMMDMHELRLGYEADLPARSGLGTSSAFAVGMIQAFYALKGKYVDKKQLADDAIYLERVLCNESGGIQDQIAVSNGGINKITFSQEGYKVEPVLISNDRKSELNGNLLLFFTGFSRYSSDIQEQMKKKIHSKEQELHEILSLVREADRILTSKTSLTEFGRLLDYSWKLKCGVNSNVSNRKINEYYQKAINAGATGGKLLGAGGGGFLLLYVEKDKQEKVKLELNNLLNIPFQFENEGSRILYYSAEDYASE